MLNFVDTIYSTDWATPLFILGISSLVALAFLATLLQWLEVWCNLIQEEENREARLPAKFGQNSRAKHVHRV